MMRHGGTEPEDFDPSEIEFVTRGVTPTEVAAVTAVLRGLLQEESDSLRQTPERGRNAWERTQRSVRGAHVPGSGHWRGFSG